MFLSFFTVNRLKEDFFPSHSTGLTLQVKKLNPNSLSSHFKSTLHYHCIKIQVLSQFGSVQSLSRVRLFVNPWTAAHEAPLSIINSRRLFRLMSIESVMPSNHLILCHPLLLLPSIFPSIRVFSNESAPCIRWPKYCSFSFNINISN